ncbi:MAG TPA: PEGA domain-containing protein [Polyangia bacterium]
MSLLVGSTGYAISSMQMASAAEMTAAPATADPALQQAKAAFEEAQTLYTKEQFEDAAGKFMVAFDKKPFSSFLFNAAVAYEKALQYQKAVDAFQRYLEIETQARDAAEVKARIESLKGVLAAHAAEGTASPEKVAAQVLPAIATKGLVIIDSKPAGASVYLDDKAKGVFAITPWQGSLEPKRAKLLLEAKGFKPEEREINPRTDKILEIFISLSEQHFLGWIEVISNVPGADVFIDRQEVGAIGRTPYTGHLKPGKHTLWVQKAGYEVAHKDVEVEPGTANTHTVNLELVSYGTLKAGSKASEGGKLFIDGVQACTLPCEQQLKPGEHVLQVQKEGMENYDGKLTVNRAEATFMDLGYSPKPSRVKAWTEAVFSAAFFAGGIVLGVKGNQVKDEINKDIKDPSKLINTSDSRKNTGRYYYIGADVCLGLGLVTAALATWNFLESGPPSTATLKTTNLANPTSGKFSFAPMDVPNGAGVAARGRF